MTTERVKGKLSTIVSEKYMEAVEPLQGIHRFSEMLEIFFLLFFLIEKNNTGFSTSGIWITFLSVSEFFLIFKIFTCTCSICVLYKNYCIYMLQLIFYFR